MPLGFGVLKLLHTHEAIAYIYLHDADILQCGGRQSLGKRPSKDAK